MIIVNNNKQALLVGFCLSVLSVSAADVADIHSEHTDGAVALFTSVYDNPAIQWNRYANSLNRINIGFYNRDATIPQQLEYGDHSSAAYGDITAFQRKGKTTVWGKALYSNGDTKNMRYNETSDFSFLYPYVIADTIAGGTTKQETYLFMGGFAYNLSKWIVAAQGQYRAQMEYRTTDPRPKNLVGDLSIKVGGAYRANDYLVGASAGFRRYKQTNEVKFYDEVSRPTSFHLTGLGTDYYRFRGTYSDTYYKGLGWSGTLNVKPFDKTGFYGSLGYDAISIEKVISELNELPLLKLSLQRQNMEFGYMKKGKCDAWGLKMQQSYSVRRGRENVFGSAQNNVYPQISSVIPYNSHNLDAMIEGFYQYRTDKSRYELAYYQGYENSKQTYASTQRLAKYSALLSKITAKALWQFSRLSLQSCASFGYTLVTSDDLQLGGNINQSLIAPIYASNAYSANNRYASCINAELSYDTSHKYSIFVAADLQYDHYAKTEHTSMVNVSLGIEF